MAGNDSLPIPLTIIAGFLGAGKTTLLNRLLRADHGLRIAVLVNDFGAINIDTQLIVGVEGETISLANGCICCTIRDDLIQAVELLFERPEPPDYIVVETSGVSDPVEVALTFRVVPQIYIDSILTVVDAEQILDIDQRYAVLALNQVGIADIVIVNKTDLVSAEHLEAVRDYIRDITPNARIYETTQALVPLELLLNIKRFDIEQLSSRSSQVIHAHLEDKEQAHDEHPHHGLAFSTWSWSSEEPVSYRALKKMVDELPEVIYRAKGIFRLADEPKQRAVLQVVGKRVSLLTQPAAESEGQCQSQIVVIGVFGELSPDELNQSMTACLARNNPESELGRLTNILVNWVRGKNRHQ